LKRACFSSIEGLLIADKTGEIGFINLNNLNKLPVLKLDLAEESKDPQHLPQFEEDGVYKTLYGHQESCLGLAFTDDGSRLVSCDTLKKINVTHFPNVFNLQSVFLEHSRPISMFVVANEKVASLSEHEGTQDLFESSQQDGHVLSKTILDKKAIGLAYIRSEDRLVIQREDGSLITLNNNATKDLTGKLADFNFEMRAKNKQVVFAED
jgi:WD40 repeat protein